MALFLISTKIPLFIAVLPKAIILVTSGNLLSLLTHKKNNVSWKYDLCPVLHQD
jgi:hypothetical protein